MKSVGFTRTPRFSGSTLLSAGLTTRAGLLQTSNYFTTDGTLLLEYKEELPAPEVSLEMVEDSQVTDTPLSQIHAHSKRGNIHPTQVTGASKK